MELGLFAEKKGEKENTTGTLPAIA